MSGKVLTMGKPTKAERATRTRLDTIEITPVLVKTWKNPPFQRPLRENEKVRTLAGQIREDGVLPGIVTLGVLGRDTYLLDGQHRVHAFVLSEVAAAYVDVRLHEFSNLGQMGEEFDELNSSLVTMRPDDRLRAIEASTPTIALIRQRCSFVGYDMIRRNANAPMLSMSMALRVWAASLTEVPTGSPGASREIAKRMQMEDAEALVDFLLMAEQAWGRDPEYARLWSALNLTLTSWLYRRMVLMPQPATKRLTKVTKSMFVKGMMALSAAHDYVDWLGGRTLSDLNRSPAYSRIRQHMGRRLEQEMGRKPLFPAPAWSSSSGGHRR